jgi:GNAT superfamily N-acetyltransferase
LRERLDLGGVALLLTATVQVNRGVAGVTAPAAEAREADYLENLRYQLHHHPRLRRIVFAENSGWPLDRFADAIADNPLGKEVELLQLGCNDFPGHLGKGYGEALLIDRALAASRLIAESGHVAQLTGRQRISNLTALLSGTPAGVRFLCDLRDHGFYERFGLPAAGRYCDTRFFLFERAFFDRHLRHRYRQAESGTVEHNLEATYYDVVKSLEREPGVLPRFRVEPRYRGRAGHWNKDYGGARERVKQTVRAVARRLFPRARF